MAAPSSNSTAAPGGDRPRLAYGAVLSRALRLATMLVLVAVGLMLLQTYRAILHDAPAPTSPAPVAPTTTPIADFGQAGLLKPGAWSLGDSNWTVALTDLTTAEGGARLQSLGFRGEITDKPSPLEEKALAWLRGSRPRRVEGCRVYDVSAGRGRIRAVTRMQRGDERLQLVQVIGKRGGALQMLEAMPAPTLGTEPANEEHLLPLPSGVASLARRWDHAGSLRGEILGPARQEECLRGWSAAGWSAERLQGPEGPISFMVLRKGGQVVHLCPVQTEPQNSPTYLLLMAEPAVKEGAR